MKRALYLLLAGLISFPAVAANKGQIILGPHDILRGHFTEQKNLQGFNGPMRSEGHFTVAPQQGLIWALDKPFSTVTVITPAGLEQSINGASVMRLPAQKMPFLLHLYDMLGGALAGNWAALDADFNVVRSGNPHNWQVTLMPRQSDNPAMPFSSIIVNGSHFVEHVAMIKADGDSDALTFLDQSVSSTSPTLAEKTAFDSVLP